MSTVEILEIPPFLAADLILASALKKRKPRYPVALAVPTFDPIVLLVALTGIVKEQLEARAAIANIDNTIFNFFMLINVVRGLII